MKVITCSSAPVWKCWWGHNRIYWELLQIESKRMT